LLLGSIFSSIQAETPGFLAGKPTGAIVIAGSTASNESSQITGANVGSNNATKRSLYTLDDHVFYSHSQHQIQAGAWLQALQSNDNPAQNQFGTFGTFCLCCRSRLGAILFLVLFLGMCH
jgi:hypothetical protein